MTDGRAVGAPRRTMLALFGLLLLVAAPYLTAIGHGFVYDDHGSIVENRFLENPANLVRVLTLRTLTDPTVPDSGRPVVVASYFLDRAIWGLRPAGFHTTNLLLHLLCVVMIWNLARRLAQSAAGDPFPWLAALLFGLHPALTEAVQVPAFREDLLCALFVLLYLCAGLRGNPLAVLLLLLALLAKEAAVVAPALLAGAWWCLPVLRPARSKIWLNLILGGLFAAGLAMIWYLSGTFQAASGTWNGLSLRFPSNLATLPWIWTRYVQLLIFPWPLVADHVVAPVQRLSDPRLALGGLALLGSVAGAGLLRRRRQLLALGIGWMLAAFLPVSNLAPLHNPMAERYLYLIAIGFALAAADALTWKFPRRAAATIALAFAVSYGLIAVLRLQHWRDDATLWSRTLLDQPASARAWTWIGLELKHRGEREQARACFEKADTLNPWDVSGLINLAVMRGEDGDLPGAEEQLREALRRQPNEPDAHWNLAVTLALQGRNRAAAAELRATLRLDPRHPGAPAALAELEANRRR